MVTAKVADVRAMEAAAVAAGTIEYTLMRRAGEGAAALILHHWSGAHRFVILSGGGNNGGDALVAAAELFRAGKRVVIYSLKEKNAFTGCAALAAADLPCEIPFAVRETLTQTDFAPGDLIIDGILGIGFAGGALRPAAASMIAEANASHCPIVALDLPSGVAGDTGDASSDGAIRAEMTITFGSPKRGLFHGAGEILRGRLRVVEIGLETVNDISGEEVFTNLDAAAIVPRWNPECHKNSRGRVAVWGGGAEYAGAPALCAAAALHAGAGMVRVISGANLVGRVPNAVICSRETEASAVLAASDAVAAGCGWGSAAEPEKLKTLLAFPGSVVLDADALNLAAKHPDLWKKRENLILTPHAGEAKRLADGFGVAVSADSREFARNLAAALHAVVLLKGRDTVVSAPNGRTAVVAAGSPSLATAGSGDTLTGVISALAASGMAAFDAATLGAFLHGVAGENAPGIPCADDLAPLVGGVIQSLRGNGIV